LGSKVESVQTDFRQGSFQETGNPLDIAIEGNGFIQLNDPSTGLPVYTRAGNLSINANYQLVVGSADTGRLVDPPITLPNTTTGVVISPSGTVSVASAGQTNYQQAGQIQLVLFPNPEGLLKLGENLYRQTDASGNPTQVQPGQNGGGQLRQGFLEASNVEPVTELIDLITTQRSFELNSQSIQVGDQVLQLIANLRR
jgi:flagellar basal-body rod protein FlgG